jgi:hypothetical protein
MSERQGRFQFTLRALAIVVTLSAVVCSYVKWNAVKQAERAAIVAALAARGVFVNEGRKRITISPEASKGLTGADLRNIFEKITARFEITAVYLENTAFDDSTVNELTYMNRRLHTAYLNGTSITDRGLAWLDSTPNLVVVNVAHTRITDKGLGRIGRVRDLISLDASRTDITDAGLRQLVGLEHLHWITLDDTKITDEGAKTIAKIPHLRQVSLARTRITDRGLEYLSGLKDLENLYLEGTGITDAGTACLMRCTKLQRLDLRGTQVSEYRKRKLKEALSLEWVL